jgi:heavy metal sensor kinase
MIMAVTWAVFGYFMFTRFRQSLLYTVDTTLQIAVTQTITSLDLEEYTEVGQLFFGETSDPKTALSTIGLAFAMRIVSPEGSVWDSYGISMEHISGQAQAGYRTQEVSGNGGAWRVFSQPVMTPDGTTIAWVQAAQSLKTVADTLQDFRNRLLWGIPIVLLLSGLGGYFLATRALQPIDQITNTAQEITASDLSRRLDYQGPEDEVGQLARTFDQMLERLQAAFVREHRFTSDAAHELRTPLTALKGRLGVTLSKRRQPSVYIETLQEMEEQVDRLIHLSNDLLFMARLDQNEFRESARYIDLNEMIEAVIDQVRPLAEAKSIRLEVAISGGLGIRGQLDLLIRLFLNLLDNAIKYSPVGGEVTIRAYRTAGGIQISVHDTGPGIASEHLPHLFERFYRVEGDRARFWGEDGQGGAGLGLAIAYEIARSQGGKLSVESKVGQGSTFRVQFPVGT